MIKCPNCKKDLYPKKDSIMMVCSCGETIDVKREYDNQLNRYFKGDI